MIENITAHQRFTPLARLRTKYNWQLATILALATLFFEFMFTLIAVSEEGFNAMRLPMLFVVGVAIVLYIIGYFPIKWYFNSISYEIVEDEVHVYRGIITKTRKIVPYRTITNLDVKQGPYDRVMDLGTIEIQTAGNSAQKMGPEERMDGLPGHEVQAIQEFLLNKVRRVRGSPATSHDLDEDDLLANILYEVKQLRKHIEAGKN